MADRLTGGQLQVLLAPYVDGLPLPPDLYLRCSAYLELLLRWNARTNLTAVRHPETLATRQLGESLFAARLVPEGGTLLDFGSGAGFPGIPLQLLRADLDITLAESQGKKSAFLREAARVLGLPTEVYAGRVEDLPDSRVFDTVAMRAVDQSAKMLQTAAGRVAQSGTLLRFVSAEEVTAQTDWQVTDDIAVPQSSGRLVCARRSAVFHVEPS